MAATWNNVVWNQFRWNDTGAVTSAFRKPKATHMIDLHKFFANPFDDAGISVDELLDFTTDHLGKLRDKNPAGLYTARIAATQAALNGVNTAFQIDLGKLGARKTSKQDKKAFRKTVPGAIAGIYAGTVTAYGANSPMLATFFPGGRTAFTTAPDDQLGNLLSTLVTELTAHAAEVGAATVTAGTNLRNGWTAVYTPSESASSAKSTSMDAKNAARAALQLELFTNLLTLALNNQRNPDALDQYMQMSLLKNPVSAAPVTPAPAPAPTP